MVLTVKGTNLPTTGTFTVKFSSGTTQTATMSGSSSTTSGNSDAIAIFPTGVVSYGMKYTISSIEHSAYSLSGTTGQSFTVPTGPARISSMTQSFTSDNRKVSVRLVGTALPTSGQITFTLSSISKSYTVACSSTIQTNTVDITIGSDKDLAASKTYTLSSVSHSAGTMIIHSSPTFTTGTPKIPTVSSVAASLAGDKKGVTLTIKGSNLPTSDSFTLKYTSGSVRTFTLNPSSTTTSASVTVPVYPTGSAEYGKTYTSSITHPSFTLDGASQSFSVPAGPPRMTDANTLTMDSKSGSKQFTAKPTSSSQATSGAITVGESGVLALGTKYSILSLTHSTATLCEGVSVTIPTLDPTVQNVKADLDTDLDFVVVILEVMALPTTVTEDNKEAIRDGWDYNPSTYNKNTVIAPSQPPAFGSMNQPSWQNKQFLEFLARLLRICPFYQPTVEIVLNMSVFLAIPSCLAFIEEESSIWDFLFELYTFPQERNRIGGEQQQMRKTVHRMLRMEGIEDVMEEKLENDKDNFYARTIVADSIEWNNPLGMNLRK
ncbi:hypothetical protein BLNAU_16570 [Blattamonas nauphoetae]|uniref:IPT/TIG domain-containing protein n=1 Tax=Blattamonas nauphoetae TaxID=2049346 RepID=A0ABQ9X871_9EUKA|nr:hypothetical protein BLNAU_16570 [Blattamonas nauphoetae]